MALPPQLPGSKLTDLNQANNVVQTPSKTTPGSLSDSASIGRLSTSSGKPRKNIVSSITDFVSKLRPRKRPERGFTARSYDTTSWDDEPQQRNSFDRTDTPFWPLVAPTRSQSIKASNIKFNGHGEPPMRLPTSVKTANREVATELSATTPNISGIEMLRPRYSTNDSGQSTLLSSPDTPIPVIPVLKPLNQAVDPSIGRSHELFRAKQAARQRRRSLKESGDYLGVTGVNPYTSEMDVLTPTTSSDEATPSSLIANSQLVRLAERAQVALEEFEHAQREIQRQYQREKQEKEERRKEATRLIQQHAKWRRGDGHWSSVAEPALSPIAQSQPSTASAISEPSTIFHSPGSSSFLGMGAVLLKTSQRVVVTPSWEYKMKEVYQELRVDDSDGNLSDSMTGNNGVLSPVRFKSIHPKFGPLTPPRQHLTACLREAEKTKGGQEGKLVCMLNLENQPLTDHWETPPVRELDQPGDSKSTSGKQVMTEHRRDRETEPSMTVVKMESGTIALSSCTSTTTTTGSGYNRRALRSRNFGEKFAVSNKGVGPKAAMSVSTEVILTAVTISLSLPTRRSSHGSSECSSGLVSPPPTQQSGWPSGLVPRPNPALGMVDGGVVATPAPVSQVAHVSQVAPRGPRNGTTSPPETQATSDDYRGQHSHLMSRENVAQKPQREMRRTMRKGVPDAMLHKSMLSHTCMSTCQLRPGVPELVPLPTEMELGTTMARGAARAAFFQHATMGSSGVRTMAVRETRGRVRRALETVEENSNHSEEDEEDTGARSGKVRRLQRNPEGGMVCVLVITVASAIIFVVKGMVSSVLSLVGPVFNPDSALRARYAERKSTPQDLALSFLALTFLFFVILVGVWVAKGFVWVVRCLDVLAAIL